jgi:hypothetical protein
MTTFIPESSIQQHRERTDKLANTLPLPIGNRHSERRRLLSEQGICEHPPNQEKSAHVSDIYPKSTQASITFLLHIVLPAHNQVHKDV